MNRMDQTLSRLHAQVEGRVQGVGFRNFVEYTAVQLGLTGWVRNRWDGSVEVVAEGENGALMQLVSALERGPRSANVTRVAQEWLPAASEFTSFSIRRTG